MENIQTAGEFSHEIFAKKVLEVEDIWKSYGKIHVLSGVTLHVSAGEIVGFLGPNGAGKTTTIGVILGLIRAQSGRVRVLGREISLQSVDALKEVGALVGQPAFFPHLTIEQNLAQYLPFHPGLLNNRITEILELAGLAAFTKRKARTLSTGMRQRLGLAFALLHKPKLLVLDEPTNGLDPLGMNEFRSLLKGLASKGIAILLSSHILSEVEQTCNRVVIINNGKIISESTISGRSDVSSALETEFFKRIK